MKIKSSFSSLSLGSKTHTFGCISLILQRFLCSGTSSTYPSDQITESSFKSLDFSSASPKGRGNGPGAVARLMGLDSVPVIDKTRVVSRSRSVKSVDYLKRNNNDGIQGKRRRVKSTIDYVELEDDNFFILSFDKRKSDKGFGELKQLGTKKCNNKRETREGKENNINVLNVSPESEKLETNELKQRRKETKKKRRKRRESKLRGSIENEDWIKSNGCWSREGNLVNCEVTSTKYEDEDCGSCDDSSLVSVLDYDRFAGSPLTPEPETSSPRRLSPDLESEKRHETIQDHNTSTSRSRECNLRHPRYQEMLPMICRLTLSELKESIWYYGKASKVEDLEGIISKDIVSNILDELLEETVTTLSLTSKV